jgi:hypothetical protein
MNFNPNTVPSILIPLDKLERAIEIKHWLSGFSRICYAIVYVTKSGNEILKFGQSAHQTDGERIYRQIWRINGWPDYPADYAAGDDFDWVVEQRPGMDKNDVVVVIYDMRNIPMLFNLAPEHETTQMESWLIDQYVKQHSRCPIGNKKEQKRLEKGLTACPKKSTVVGKSFYNLFEEVQQ